MKNEWQPDIDRPFRRFLSKVPEVTIWFWIVKILATTVGETFADFLSTTLGLGLTLTTVAVFDALIVVMIVQLRAGRYVPPLYWLVVMLVGIVGMLITDNLVDNLDIPLEATTIALAVALAATFVLWYRAERTLSIHTVDTPRREMFYWLAILFAFSLGTAAGGLAVARLGLGYAVAAVILAALIAVIAVAHQRFGFHAVLAFWLLYILTGPLGAALGDLLSQPADAGGLGLGTVTTSVAFLAVILAVVAYLSRSRRDAPALSHNGASWMR
ncbi:MAG: hypothetical protein QOC94_135 [Actinoplanes sp.]|jgi:uncharacterized membrane-anchored protein|nr:hypothetical protein [Actinoplanes sp.]